MIVVYILAGLVGLYLIFQGGSVAMGIYYSGQARRLAAAISVAEGTTRPDGSPVVTSLGWKNNNPGDILNNAGMMITYPDIQTGWDALYKQAESMIRGTSSVYSPGMSLMQTAQLYTGGDNAVSWAGAVAQQLGLSITNTLEDVGTLA